MGERRVTCALTIIRDRMAGRLTAAGLAVLLSLSLGACATKPAAVEVAQATPAPAPAPADVDEDVNDPLEPVNRGIFTFNEIFYQYVLEPVATTYVDFLPATFRQAVRNFLNNLNSPVVLANDLLQGEGKRALETFGRAFVNSTIGMGGIIDMGAEMGVKRHDEDFGQTLAVWGAGEGFYLVLPIFGPSNPRDAVGKLVVDSYLDPLGLWLDNIDRDDLIWARRSVDGVDEYSRVMEELKQVKKTSIDYYAAIRSLHRQKREADIANGNDLKLPAIPDLTYESESIGLQPASAPSLRPGTAE